MKTDRLDRLKTAALPVAIVVLALALRLVSLQSKTFYIDEAFNFALSGHNFGDILKGSASESNPPLPAMIFHLWQAFLPGDAEWQLRMLSVLFSLATVVAAYAGGGYFGGRRTAAFAGLIVAVSPFYIEYAQIYRYPALAILTGALCHLSVYSWLKKGGAAPLALVSLSFIAGLYTHYFFIFLVFSANVHVLVALRKDPRRLVGWLVSQAAVALVFLPWFASLRRQAAGELSIVEYDDLIAHLKTFPFLTAPHVAMEWLVGRIISTKDVFQIISGFASIAICGAFFLKRCRPFERAFVLWNIIPAVLIPCFMMLFLELRLQMMYFCMLAPLFAIGAATGLSSAFEAGAPGKLLSGVVISMIALSCVFYYPRIRVLEDNKSIIRHIQTEYRDGDVVAINPTYQASLFAYYGKKPMRIYGIPKVFDVLSYSFKDIEQVTPEWLEKLDAMVAPGGKVWHFCGFGIRTKPDQNALVSEHLAKNYKLIEIKKFSPASYVDDIGTLEVYQKELDE